MSSSCQSVRVYSSYCVSGCCSSAYFHVQNRECLLPLGIHEETKRRRDRARAGRRTLRLPVDEYLMQRRAGALPDELLAEQDGLGERQVSLLVAFHLAFAEDPPEAIGRGDGLLDVAQQCLREVLQGDERARIDLAFQRVVRRADANGVLRVAALVQRAHANHRSTLAVDERGELLTFGLRALDRSAEHVDHLIVRVHLIVEQHRHVLIVLAFPEPKRKRARSTDRPRRVRVSYSFLSSAGIS